jgi:molybdopterin synthase catalytic subunit
VQAVIRIQHAVFDVGAEVFRLEAAGVGAVVTFTGLVRNHSALGDVAAIELEHYAGMTEKSLHAMVAEAQKRWPLCGVTIIHRVGYLKAGEPIVLVAVAAVHRAAAFSAASFLMDWLKTGAPFWKKEWVNGVAHWVDAKESDVTAAQRWLV